VLFDLRDLDSRSDPEGCFWRLVAYYRLGQIERARQVRQTCELPSRDQAILEAEDADERTRGLPAAERESFSVRKVERYAPYNRVRSPRAIVRGHLRLVPPAVWGLRSADRRTLRRELAHAGTPEHVGAIVGALTRALGGMGAPSSLIAPAKPAPSREATIRVLTRMAEREQARTTSQRAHDAAPSAAEAPTSTRATESPPPNPDLTPSGWEGGYASSEHSHGELAPKARTLEGPDQVKARREERARREREAIQEKFMRWGRRDTSNAGKDQG